MEENINPFHPDNQRKPDYKIISNNKRNLISAVIALGCGIIAYVIKPVPIGYLAVAAAFGILGFLILIWDIYSPMKWKTSLAVILTAVLQRDVAVFFRLQERYDSFFTELRYLPIFLAAFCLTYLLLKAIFRKLLNRIIEAKAKRQGRGLKAEG